jgi:hypothetical protein
VKEAGDYHLRYGMANDMKKVFFCEKKIENERPVMR